MIAITASALYALRPLRLMAEHNGRLEKSACMELQADEWDEDKQNGAKRQNGWNL